ncbi:MAG: S9 family peptidase [Actinomycetota bacterium]|nr:S9 family peptidase [Actinomycetota bacterium]
MTAGGSPSRRVVLGALAASGLGLLTGCAGSAGTRQTDPVQPPAASSATAGPAPARHHYGSDPSQWGELYLPDGPKRAGTAIVIHGGFWRAEYGADLGAPLAADLAARGWTAWNLEYRRVGIGGGWPNTLTDIAAGIDYLAGLLPASDLHRVVAIGHSAGGQLAAWAAHRGKLAAGEPGAAPKVRLSAVVSQAGVLDLVSAATDGVGGTAVADLLGGSPAAVPERYRIASPQAHLPLAVPVRCIHATADTNVPYSQSVNYVRAAKRAGGDADLVQVPGDHFTLIDTSAPAWQAVLRLLPVLLG